MALEKDGYLTIEELKGSVDYPDEERFKEGPIAIIECVQEIPCNPCETSCPFKAIEIKGMIADLPTLDMAICKGCGVCVAQCPGMAIFIVNKSYSKDKGTVAFPYEYFPLPVAEQEVDAVNRKGETVCKGRITKVQNPASFDRTPVVTVEVPIEFAEEVRSIKRLG